MKLEELKKVPITQLATIAGYEVRGNQLWSGGESHSCFIDLGRNIFKWFAKDKGGSAIDFVMVVEDCSFQEACRILEGLVTNGSVALQQVVVEAKPKKVPSRIDKSIVQAAALQLSEAGRDYWLGRGVSLEVLEKLQIGEIYRYNRYWFTYPVIDKVGEPVFFKLRICPWSESPEKASTFPTGHSAFLFPYSSLKDRADRLIICEGESDTLVALSHGLQAICGTHGASTWTQTMTEHIVAAYPKKVIVAYDRDEAGERGAKRVQSSLQAAGLHCSIFTIPKPYKDMADYLSSTTTIHAELTGAE